MEDFDDTPVSVVIPTAPTTKACKKKTGSSVAATKKAEAATAKKNKTPTNSDNETTVQRQSETNGSASTLPSDTESAKPVHRTAGKKATQQQSNGANLQALKNPIAASTTAAKTEQSKKRAADSAPEQSAPQSKTTKQGSNAAATTTTTTTSSATSRLKAALNTASNVARGQSNYIPNRGTTGVTPSASTSTSSGKTSSVADQQQAEAAAKAITEELKSVNVLTKEKIAEWQLEVKPSTNDYVSHTIKVMHGKKQVRFISPAATTKWAKLHGLGAMSKFTKDVSRCQYMASLTEQVPDSAAAADPNLQERSKLFYDQLYDGCSKILELMFEDPEIQIDYKQKLYQKALEAIVEKEADKNPNIKDEDFQKGGKYYEDMKARALKEFIASASVWFNKKDRTDQQPNQQNKANKGPIVSIKKPTADGNSTKGSTAPRDIFLTAYVFSAPKPLDEADTEEGGEKGKEKDKKVPAKVTTSKPKSLTFDPIAFKNLNPKQLHSIRNRMEAEGYSYKEFVIMANKKPVSKPDFTTQLIYSGALLNYLITPKPFSQRKQGAGQYGIHLEMARKAWYVKQGTMQQELLVEDETSAADEEFVFLSRDDVEMSDTKQQSYEEDQRNNNNNNNNGEEDGEKEDGESGEGEQEPQNEPGEGEQEQNVDDEHYELPSEEYTANDVMED